MRSISPYERYGDARPESEAALTIHTVIAGETLSMLADRYYADWRRWRLIADRNQIQDPRKIEPGTQLIVPRLPLERGRYESL
ncbi:MAG: LysM peptidoglycan-binding domain-containing protein [Acidobacteriota bacterium]|nr:MAG: LysM peptidoglycan-binding domain-containing protein [Acidobacteriota bacterium]